jgi:hypothetical protein
MIVVEASAMIEALLRTPAAAAVEARLFEPGETLRLNIAPRRLSTLSF